MEKADIRATVRSGIASLAGLELADRLLREFDELNHRFQLGDFRPSELSGARFSEAAFRICEQVCLGKYTPVKRSLPKIDELLRMLEQVPSNSADDTFRFHIPRTLRVIYDLRNKRDVAHLGDSVSPNFMDASLVLACASWVVAEIVRISHQCDIATAQGIVNALVQRRTPLIWNEGNVVRVLRPALLMKDKVLLILHHLQPEWVGDEQLCRWLEYSNLSVFRSQILQGLHHEALIHYQDGKAKILPTGNQYVENQLRVLVAGDATQK